MVPDVQRLAVAIVLPSEPAERLDALQRKHRLPPWAPAIPFHITVIAPFTTHQTPESLAERLSGTVAKTAAFELKFAGLGRFDNGFSVIYAPVLPSGPLSSLVTAVDRATEGIKPRRQHKFIPHVTLANRGPRETVDLYWGRLANEDIDERFLCTGLSVLRLDEDMRIWRVERTLSFSS